MPRAVPVTLVAAALTLLLATQGGTLDAQPSPDAPMPVLSDTPEYCALLEAKIGKQANRPAEVRQLVREGHLLCDHGQVREGISRLRRALLMTKHKAPVLMMP